MRKWTSRSTIFAAFFAATAFVLALLSKLTPEYVAVITALHVTVTARAIAQDRNADSNPNAN